MAKTNKYILPVGIAVAAAGAIFFFTRKANAADIAIEEPTVDDPDQPPPPPAKPTGGGGGGVAKSNPSVAFPYGSMDQALIAENGASLQHHAAWMEAVTEAMADLGQGDETSPSAEAIEQAKDELGINGNVASWLASRAYYELYSTGKIPPKSERKDGWKPYVDSWIRMHDFLKTMPWV